MLTLMKGDKLVNIMQKVAHFFLLTYLGNRNLNFHHLSLGNIET